MAKAKQESGLKKARSVNELVAAARELAQVEKVRGALAKRVESLSRKLDAAKAALEVSQQRLTEIKAKFNAAGSK